MVGIKKNILLSNMIFIYQKPNCGLNDLWHFHRYEFVHKASSLHKMNAYYLQKSKSKNGPMLKGPNDNNMLYQSTLEHTNISVILLTNKRLKLRHRIEGFWENIKM